MNPGALCARDCPQSKKRPAARRSGLENEIYGLTQGQVTLDDTRGDEDQQLGLVVYLGILAEQEPDIRYVAKHDKLLVFLTNNFDLPALTVTQLYRCRWQVELFFKWIKQHLRIKAFFGTSENAVKTQVWIAITVYVLVAIVKKRLNLDPSLYTILQLLGLTLFEKTPLNQLLANIEPETDVMINSNQPNLFT